MQNKCRAIMLLPKFPRINFQGRIVWGLKTGGREEILNQIIPKLNKKVH